MQPNKINFTHVVQALLLIVMLGLVVGVIQPENGLDINATVSKLAAMVVGVQVLNFATARLLVSQLAELDLGKNLNPILDAIDSGFKALGDSQPVTNLTVTVPALPTDSAMLATDGGLGAGTESPQG